GAAGMLGRDVVRAGERAGHELLALARTDLDVSDEAAVTRAFAALRPDAAINCAAWTDVDGAERDPAGAHAVNAGGARNLAHAAAPRHTVARSSWLFGTGGHNFAATMLRLAQERDAVQVVTDQVGCPTWTGQLAPALIGLLAREVTGLVHLAGSGHVSWNGFAREIFRQADVDCRVDPADSAQLARPAPRPAWSALASERDDVLAMPDWRDGLAGYLAARAGMMRA